jgi:hypothetical protein
VAALHTKLFLDGLLLLGGLFRRDQPMHDHICARPGQAPEHAEPYALRGPCRQRFTVRSL